MYKIGDRLLCKKKFDSGYVKFHEGYTYDVIGTNKSDKFGLEICIEDGESMSWWFTYRLNEFFYTTNEVRKLKLERLQCIK